MMRPYQIVATERILQRIEISTNYKQLGTIAAGGYIWHTTGSGKTLTTSRPRSSRSQLPSVDKVLFVVDRKDLDYQTMREYDRFEKGAANSNTSTAVLKRQLEDPSARIIITTIQKLARSSQPNKGHAIYDGHVVIIFDECHRSPVRRHAHRDHQGVQALQPLRLHGHADLRGERRQRRQPELRTTEQAFGDELHTYTIVDAINDKNVLPFRIDYVNTIKLPDDIADKQVSAIDTEKALLAPERIRQIVAYILEHFDQKTKRAASTTRSAERAACSGFNALFATASIEAAQALLRAVRRAAASADLPSDQRLKVGLDLLATPPNEAVDDGCLDEEGFETDALDAVLARLPRGRHPGLQRHVRHQLRHVGRQVPELLQGPVAAAEEPRDRPGHRRQHVPDGLRRHDAEHPVRGQEPARPRPDPGVLAHQPDPQLGQDLRQHRLLPRPGGETNDAIALFGNKDARGIVLLKPYGDYYAEYAEKVARAARALPARRADRRRAAQKDFIALFGAILRLQNILTSFDEFAGNEILTERQSQDYRSVYLDLYAEFRRAHGRREGVDQRRRRLRDRAHQAGRDQRRLHPDARREVARGGGDGDDKEIRADDHPRRRRQPDPAQQEGPHRGLRRLRVGVGGESTRVARASSPRGETAELDPIIDEEGLSPTRRGRSSSAPSATAPSRPGGTAITKVLPPVSRFAADGHHALKKAASLRSSGVLRPVLRPVLTLHS